MSVTVTQELTQQTVTVTGNPVENNVTVTVSNARGPAGLAASGAITSATTSDGTADLLLSNVETVTAEVTDTLIAPHIHGNLAGSVYAHVRAGEALEKGDPVYVSGSHGSGATLIAEVSKADASNAAKMPAVGIVDEDIGNNANGHMVIVGTITELNTAGLAINAELYVAAGGGLTSTPPAARAQPVARVERANANNGAILVKVNGLSASDATPSTLVRRDANGGASLNGLTLSGTGGSPFTSTLTGGVNFANRTFTLPDASGALATVESLANSATITASTAVAVNTIVLRDGAGQIEIQNSSVTGSTSYGVAASWTYGTGAAAAHRTALGLGTGDVAIFSGVGASTLRASNGSEVATLDPFNFILRTDRFSFGSSGTGPNLFRDGNGILSQRSGGIPQTFLLYNTYSSSTNFERLNFRWSGNTAFIGTEKGSASPGGTARDLVLETDGTERVRVEASGQIITKSNLRLETPTGAGAGLITTNMSNTPSLTLTQSNGNKLSINPGDGNIARSTSANVALSLSFQTGGGNVGIGTTTPASKLTVTGGDIEATDSASGVILKSPDGNRWRVTVDNTGALTTTLLA